MKQSISKAALYLRLSREDGESDSIQNQQMILENEAKRLGYEPVIYVDDGITGTINTRPAYQQMFSDMEQGKLAAVLVKDLSRLGRDHIEVGLFIKQCVDFNDVRIIAVTDNFDSREGVDLISIALKNVINESYAQDISKKCRAVSKLKGSSGIPLGRPPYGYKIDPDNPKHWIVEPEAAAIVKRIFTMTIEGVGTAQIASTLETEGVLTPMNYWKSKGINRGGKSNASASSWNSSTIIKMLSLQEYCGDVINFKTYTASYKNKKQRKNDRDSMAIFKDVHAPIVDRATFEKIQQKRSKMRKRSTSDGKRNMFSGVVVCADCGANLNYHYSQSNKDIKYFNCPKYNCRNRLCPTSHHIRVEFLEQVVLGEIKRLAKFARNYEDEFAQLVKGSTQDSIELERKRREKELRDFIARNEDIDMIIQKLYEDSITGKVSDERFAKLSKSYEREQTDLSGKIASLQKRLADEDSRSNVADSFVQAVRKYSRVRKLTPLMLGELVQRIEVYQSEKVDGVYVQRLDIYYHGVGTVAIPDKLFAPEIKIRVQTRKGVTVTYMTPVVASQ